MKIEAVQKLKSDEDFWSQCQSITEGDNEALANDLKAIYGIKSPEHSFGNGKRCKKNCKTNVRCYTGFGEEKWLSPRKPKASSSHNNNKAVVIRDSDFPAGLVNLGTTCYVNSCLQLWFNNVWLREAIYEWNPNEDPEEKNNDSLNSGPDFKPKSKVGTLQLLFAQMQASCRSALDPRDFVAKLGLDHDVQQDAQEFSKLFLMLLESCLSSQSNPKVRNIVQSQFCGNFAYVTTCSKCKRESCSPSQFSELLLAVQDKRTLLECIDEYFSKEVLAGDNKYFCSHCKEKRNATRCIKITKLPPVLNISLNRFVFDVKTGSRKKLNTAIQYPEILDMSSYLKMPSRKLIYNLTGVLIHIGGNAHRGHYKAQVKNLRTGAWYQYSDTEVEVLDSKVGYECEVTEKESAKKTPSKQLGSTTAYMLVYTSQSNIDKLHSADRAARRSLSGLSVLSRNVMKRKIDENPTGAQINKKSRLSEPNPILDVTKIDGNTGNKGSLAANQVIGPTNVPSRLQRLVILDNMKLKVEAEMIEADKVSADADQKTLVSQMADVLSQLSFEDDSDEYEFLPSSWLRSFIQRPSTIKEIITTTFLCKHQNVDFEKIVMLKAVSSVACEKLYQYFPTTRPSTRLTNEKLCHLCLRTRVLQTHLNSRSLSDSKIIQDLLKEPIDERSTENFWVGKRSLQRWRSYAQIILTEKILGAVNELETNGNNKLDEFSNDPGLSNANGSHFHTEYENHQDNLDNKANGQSNDDNEVSEKLGFNEEIVCFHGNLSPDPSNRRLVCKELWEVLRYYFPQSPEFSGKAKSCLSCESSMDREKNLSKEIQALALLQKNALGSIFVDRSQSIWPRNCIKAYVISKCFVQKWKSWIRNPCADNQLRSIENAYLMCTHKKLLFSVDEKFGDVSESQLFLLADDEWERLEKNFHVDFVITIKRNRPRGSSTGSNVVTYYPELCVDCVEKRRLRDEELKLQYQNAAIYVRKIASKEAEVDENSSHNKNGEKIHVVNSDHLRVSQRHQKVQGEKIIKARSSMTVKDLKVVISKAFQLSSDDPILQFSGLHLTENEKTLAESRIFPASVILLVNDDPPTNKSKKNTPRRREEGFKGTGLLASIF